MSINDPCYLRAPDHWCHECRSVARENYLRAMRMVEVVERDPRIFSSETRASVEMMRWIVRHYESRCAQLEEEARQWTATNEDLSAATSLLAECALDATGALAGQAKRTLHDRIVEYLAPKPVCAESWDNDPCERRGAYDPEKCNPEECKR